MRRLLLIMIVLGLPFSSRAVSLVYNLRIAETTKSQAVRNPELVRKFKQPSIAAFTAVSQWRERYSGSHESIIAGLGSLIYAPESWYFKVDAALGRVRERDNDACFARTQMDDLLFSAGYGYRYRKNIVLSFSAMAGFPTHNDRALEGIQFGTGHYGIGAQVDALFAYAKRHNILTAVRFIHFMPRSVVAPHYQGTIFEIHPGNLADLLIAHRSAWGQHGFEIGYNPSFAFNGFICPPLDPRAQHKVFVRHSFYANYRYLFLLGSNPSAIIVGTSYGFDSSPKDLGIKNVGSLWLSWGINF